MSVRSGLVKLGSLGSRRRNGCARMLAIAHAAKSEPRPVIQASLSGVPAHTCRSLASCSAW
eukprot:15281522-Heterocapsa_arctica.AAC.1